MDNEKRIFLAILLSIVILYFYQSFFAPPPKQPVQKPSAEQLQQEPQHKPEQPSTAPVQQSLNDINIKQLSQQAGSTAVSTEKTVQVTTNLFSASFLSTLGSPNSFSLHNYKEAIEQPAFIKSIKKIFSSGSTDKTIDKSKQFKELIHVPQNSTLPLKTLFVDTDNKIHGSGAWQSDQDRITLDRNTQESALVFSNSESQGLSIHKKFIFRESDYKIDFNVIVSNTSSTSSYTGNAVIEWTAPSAGKSSSSFFGGDPSLVSQFAYFINGKVEKKDFGSIKEEITIEGDILWTSIEEKYFTSAIISKDQKPVQIRLGKTADNLVAYQLFYPLISLKPGEEKLYTFSLYLGPKDIDILKSQGAHLEQSVVFGWFDIIARPLLFTLKFFNAYLGNYGLAIILLTIIIKILFWPLTHKSFESMKSMQQIQPELAILKEKYKDNKEEFAKQQLAIYKKYKVNPLSGCLPTIIQIPVFIALYNSLMYAIELRHANFISFWINDLSDKDPTYIAPIIMGFSMLVQQKMTPTSADPAQAKVMMFMPIIFTVMFLSFPSGLVIYWLVNNVISIAQQLYINKKLTVPGGKECSPSKSKQNPSKKRSQ